MSFSKWIQGLFKEEPKIVKEDPFFGKMEFCVGAYHRHWRAEVMTPIASRSLEVLVEADENGPDEFHYALMELLYKRYGSLRDQLETELYERYKPWQLSDCDWGKYDSPDMMLEFNDLGFVRLCADPRYYYELEYHVRDDLSPNYTLSLFFTIDAHWHVEYAGGAD